MNIQEIYENFDIRARLDQVFQEFKTEIENDEDFSLSDDEVIELFMDLVQEYQNEYTNNFEPIKN